MHCNSCTGRDGEISGNVAKMRKKRAGILPALSVRPRRLVGVMTLAEPRPGTVKLQYLNDSPVASANVLRKIPR